MIETIFEFNTFVLIPREESRVNIVARSLVIGVGLRFVGLEEELCQKQSRMHLAAEGKQVSKTTCNFLW
jgi:hypothetical protein